MPILTRLRRTVSPVRATTSDLRGIVTPHLAMVRAPSLARAPRRLRGRFLAATYNVHRWAGLNGHRRPDPAPVFEVIGELGADLIALQEVLRPAEGDDPLAELGDALGFHLAFAVTRAHRRGEIGNAILSRWPLSAVSILDLTLGRLERRAAVTIRVDDGEHAIDVVSTHLALSDRMRRRQVEALLGHPRLRERPTLILGDMNAWRRSRATEALVGELGSHNNRAWPASFPAMRPLLALDRIYARGVQVLDVSAHRSRAARTASDHLPVTARIDVSWPGRTVAAPEGGP